MTRKGERKKTSLLLTLLRFYKFKQYITNPIIAKDTGILDVNTVVVAKLQEGTLTNPLLIALTAN